MLFKKTSGLLCCLILSTTSIFAVMPPEVYKKRIEDSLTKAVAEVTDVKVVNSAKHRITKIITFKLIKSYGKEEPAATFKGWCYSVGPEPMVGGDIYYTPGKGEKVFVTIRGGKTRNPNGKPTMANMITSYTPMTAALEKALAQQGLKGLEYGMGTVKAR